MNEVKLITVDPAHFHAALVQKEMYPQVSRQVHVYGPMGTDLTAHLNRIVGFNSRPEKPTDWEMEVHACPHFLEKMLEERPGNVVILSGRNHVKIDYILAAVEAGLHVLADKPWILTADQLPKLRGALEEAERKGLVIYDIMTERFEITSLLQKELVNDPGVFGTINLGTPENPAISMESVHYLMKQVAGVPLRRPAWYFDIHRQGEGLNDVGTHLVDLVPWILFPGQSLDAEGDLKLLGANRWPTVLSLEDYRRVTGELVFPPYLREMLREGKLDYFCNNTVTYSVRGVHVKLDVLWDFEAEAGAADTHLAVFRGSKASVEIHQGKEQNFKPELFVVPRHDVGSVGDALQKKLAQLQDRFPGVAMQKQGQKFLVSIPDKYRVGHEAHFAEVTQQFLRYLQDPASLPAWESPNMLAKYTVTTKGVQLSRQSGG